jgi:acyl carrier protein
MTPPVNEVVALVMGLDPLSIDDDSRMNAVKNWDSMQQIILMSVLEQTYGVKFTLDEMNSLDNVRAIRLAIETREA